MSAPLASDRPEAPLFSDGIGDRVVSADGATGELVQVLRLNPAMTAVPSFEFALRERVARLANFRHGYYARVRRVDRAPGRATALSIVSDHVEGTRLSEILRVAGERRLHLDTNAALCLVRQLVPAVAVLHENARDVAHGLIAAERLIVTPHARLAIAEHVLGAAIEQMQYGRERLWHEFRVAMPPSAGIPRFDQRSDVAGIGVVALSLILGRPLETDEYPARLGELLQQATERSAVGEEQPLSAPLRSWLARALQIDVRRAFASAPEALAALEQLTADVPAYVPAPVALEMFLSRYVNALLSPAPIVSPKPVAAALPPIELFSLTEEAAIEPAAPLPPALEAGEDPFAQFLAQQTEAFQAAEPAAAPEPQRPPARRGGGISRKWLAVAASVIVVAGGGYAGLRAFTRAAAPAMATLAVQSNPSGAPVFVDGVERGVTPARITLAPGSHILELRGRGVPRVIPVTLAAGAEVSQYLEFAEAPVSNELLTPSPAAPPAAAAPAPVAEAPAAPLAGWITVVKMPFALEIRENGRLLGTTDAERLMVAAGKHELEFVNDTLQYRAAVNVQVPAGKVTPITLQLPRGTISLNATPWAEVWIDGQRAGETPIGNLSVSIGAHEVVFRHPQLGEKRHAVSVTAGAPVRLSVDMK